MLDENILLEFTEVVGEKYIKIDHATLLAYSYDSTTQYQALPNAVISPKNKEEIAEIVKICNKYKVPIVPRGSGTNLCAGTTPLKGGIVLLFNRMNQILELDEKNLTITVQPGVITKKVAEAANDANLFYPPDPGSLHISQIGGNISENSGGLRGLKYGVTSDYVLGLEVVLPNGEIIHTGGKLYKDVAGYDLTSLFTGSEGTLGIITEAILKLIPKPETSKTMLALFNNLEDAAKTVSHIIADRIIPVTLEFLDQKTIQVVEDYSKIGLPTNAKAVLLIEQDGYEQAVHNSIDRISNICEKNGAFDIQIAKTVEEAESLTTARRVALSALSRLRPTTILEDATVPRSEIANMVHIINRIAKKYDLMICTFGHAGDGNLHPTCLTDIRDKTEMAKVDKAFKEIFEAAIKLGGTITGEHGVGSMKLPYLHLKVGEQGIEVMRNIKKSIDPNFIMNPGKIFNRI